MLVPELVTSERQAELVRRIRNTCALFMTRYRNEISRVEQQQWFAAIDSEAISLYLYRNPSSQAVGYGLVRREGEKSWLTGGLRPEYRGQGLESLLLLQLVETAYQKGYRFGEMSWILESNDKVQRSIELLGGEIYKTYRIYQKPL